jgi:predicted GIY-YIG superfamily endonuclease
VSPVAPPPKNAKGDNMHFVYLIQSLSNRTQYYTGLTDSLPQRLEAHNSGESTHTSKFRP